MPRRRSAAVALVLAVGLTAGACREHTVAIRFDPDVGDRYRFRSDIQTEVSRTLEGETTVERNDSRLAVTESIVELAGDEIGVEVTVRRDGAVPRTYEVRFDRTGRLATIDLVEGVPASALGLDLATTLPADLASPPQRRLEPGESWEIERRVSGPDRDVVVTGRGRVESLGVEDGTEVAVVVVDLTVPVRSVVDTDDGRVSLLGSQSSRSRTAYDLSDGSARRDVTEISGEVELVFEAPEGVDAPPVPGSVHYDVRTDTRRDRVR